MTYIPCRLTSTAQVSGCSSIACSSVSARSSSLQRLNQRPLALYKRYRNSLRSILNDGYPQPIIVPQITRLPPAPRNPLNLLHPFNFKTAFRPGLALDDERYQHSPLGMRVDAAARRAFVEGCEEERCALGWVEGLRFELVQLRPFKQRRLD